MRKVFNELALLFALIFSAIVAVAVSPAPAADTAPASADAAAPNPFFIDLSLVPQIVCDKGLGSGAWIRSDRVLTAAHVAAAGNCKVAGLPTKTIYIDGVKDVAVLETAARSATEMAVNCVGPKVSARYLAVGHAFGAVDAVITKLTGTRSEDDGQNWFRGEIYPGMSGGPIVDSDGDIVAIVNRYPTSGVSLSLGLSVAATALCGGA